MTTTTAKCERPDCTHTVEINPNRSYVPRFCSRQCARQVGNAQRAERLREEWYASEESLCACRKGRIPYETRHSVKYCSAECRVEYGKPRGKPRDPEKWVTFNCQNCGDEVTRYKSYGNGAHKYCSNECAQRHTKIKQHIVVDDAVVLDSPWEAFFWGLCSMFKLQVERYDREQGVEWLPGRWYAPDFWLPTKNLAVEIKGYADEEDPAKWWTFTQEYNLAVLGRDELEMLRKSNDIATTLCGIAQVIKP